MSDLAQAALISGSIFVLVMARGYGRRVFDRGAVIMPLVMIGAFGFIYLRHAPLASVDLAVYAVAIAVGLVFGGVATAVTGLERDERDGRTYTIAGPAFAAVWALAVVLRLGFIWSVNNWDWARMHFGEFMLDHRISLDAIAPFFLLWALAMVLSRMVALKAREVALQGERRTAVTV